MRFGTPFRLATRICGPMSHWGGSPLPSSSDPSLARGHFGYAFELVERALPRDFAGRLPRDRPANRPFYEAIDGLVECLEALGQAPRLCEASCAWLIGCREGQILEGSEARTKW